MPRALTSSTLGSWDSLDAPYLDLIQDVEFQPVFILGLNRSGTTILYQVLNHTGCFNSLTVFNLLNRRRLLYLHRHPAEAAAAHANLNDWFEKRQILVRTYDHAAVGSDLPEEYGYALGSSDIKPRLKESNLKEFLILAKKIQFTEDERRPLLLKNPWDTNHFLDLQRFFPDARFIFIHRNPVPVISSQMKMFGGLIQDVSAYDMLIEPNYERFCNSLLLRTFTRLVCADRLPFLFWRLYRNAIAGCEYMERHMDALGDAAISITYQQLCSSPRPTVERLMSFLGESFTDTRILAEKMKAREQAIHPTVERFRKRIEERTQGYCRKFDV